MRPSKKRDQHGRLVNRTEANVIRAIVDGMVAAGVPRDTIGIISPYRSQVNTAERQC